MRKIAVVALSLVLTGCAGAKYAMDNYTGVDVKHYTAKSGQVFRIFDKPNENRMMITPSIGASVASGAVQGATFGAINPAADAVVFREAAEQYLASTGRLCVTRDTTMIINPQYEVRYQCDGAPAPSTVETSPAPAKKPS